MNKTKTVFKKYIYFFLNLEYLPQKRLCLHQSIAKIKVFQVTTRKNETVSIL